MERATTGLSLLQRMTAWLPAAAPLLDYPFGASDIALLRQHTDAAANADASCIDGQTWDDLMLADYAAQLGRDTSIFGQQVLHRRLHGAGADADQSSRVRALTQDAPLTATLSAACRELRQADTEVSADLFGPADDAAPWWSGWLWLVPLAFLLSLASVYPLGSAAWLAVLAVWVALMVIQVQFYERAKQWERRLKSLRHLLRVHGALGRVHTPLTQPLLATSAEAAKATRAIERSALNFLPVARDYCDWVLLSNIKHYFHSRKQVDRHRAFLRDSFLLVANLEADLALARHLLAAPVFCWAADAAADALALRGVIHPLLPQATPLSLTLHGKGAFLSGQNGIGKSTLLRTIGLNLVSARAFGFCYADSAAVPRLAVHTSMQSEDTLTGGESLYQAELRRAQELLALAAGPRPVLLLIDEIFRGTNHLESVSAAAAVLHTLAARATVIVSSHNLVLAQLLEDCLAPLCVTSQGGALRLRPGVLERTNGIALLAERGFGAAIEGKAGRVFDWLSTYMAHPLDCAGVLEQ